MRMLTLAALPLALTAGAAVAQSSDLHNPTKTIQCIDVSGRQATGTVDAHRHGCSKRVGGVRSDATSAERDGGRLGNELEDVSDTEGDET